MNVFNFLNGLEFRHVYDVLSVFTFDRDSQSSLLKGFGAKASIQTTSVKQGQVIRRSFGPKYEERLYISFH